MLQAIRDLIRLGVGLEVQGESATFLLPDGEPERSRAEAAVKRALPLVRDHRSEVIGQWPKEAIGRRQPRRCAECRAWVFCVPRVVTWAFCESLYCPHRTDDRSRRAKWFRDQDRKRQKDQDEFILPD